MTTDQKNREQENDRPIDILLVEDNEDDILITKRAFEKAKLKNNTFVVNDGKDALDFLRHQEPYQDEEKCPRPDLILLDIKMPKMDGFELLEEIKADKAFCSIPVIMLTSSQDENDIVKSYRLRI